MKTSTFILALCLFISCTSKHEPKTMTEMFSTEETSVEQEVSLESDSIRNPYMIACAQQMILLADIFQPTFITAFDEGNGTCLGNFLPKGMGPDEFIHLSSMRKVGEKLFAWDSGKSIIALLELNRDSLENYTSRLIPVQQDSTLVSVFQMHPLSEGLFVTSGVIKGGRFAILNDKGEVISLFGSYPESDTGKEKSDMELAFSNQCSFAYQPEKKVLAVANGMGETIQFYHLGNLSSPRLMKEYHCASPQYKVDKDGSIAYTKENIIGFKTLLTHSKYCIGFFYGKSLDDPRKYGCDKLLYFDWEGNPVKIKHLSRMYSNITLNEAQDKAYLLGKDPHTSDFKVYGVGI